MPVELKLQTLASNKAKIPLSIHSQILKDRAYVRVIKGASVYICKPRIDKLSLTVAINCTESQAVILEMLEGEVKYVPTQSDLGNHGKLGLSSASKPKGGHYQFYYKFRPAGTQQTVHLAVKPTKPGSRFLRLEFNPDQLGPSGVAALRDFIDTLFVGALTYQHVLEDSIIQKIDIACDLVNVPMGAVLIRSKLKGKSMHYVGDAGLETSYQGKSSKAAPIKVYDKKKQIVEAKGGTPPFGELSHIRVEISKRTNSIPLCNLGKFSNVMQSVEVLVAAPEMFPEQEHHWQFFVDSCQFRGIDAALNLMPEGLRKAYRKALNGGSDPLWDPVALWSCWPQVVAESGLLEPYNAGP